MTDADETNLRAAVTNLVKAVSAQTGHSRFYIARLAETYLQDLQRAEMRDKQVHWPETSNDAPPKE